MTYLILMNRDDLIATLDALLEKKHDIEYILVEANGLADPGAIISTFWLDEGLESKIELLQTIVVANAKDFNSKMQNRELVDTKDSKFSESDLLLRQLIQADKMLINKTDLLGKGEEKDAIL
jgi:G3E family GTPase